MALLHENPFLSFFPKILSQKVLNEVVVLRVPSHDQHKVRYSQCDNIGRNFATLARLFKSLAIFWVLSKYLARFLAYFGKSFIMIMEKLLVLRMAKH